MCKKIVTFQPAPHMDVCTNANPAMKEAMFILIRHNAKNKISEQLGTRHRLHTSTCVRQSKLHLYSLYFVAGVPLHTHKKMLPWLFRVAPSGAVMERLLYLHCFPWLPGVAAEISSLEQEWLWGCSASCQLLMSQGWDFKPHSCNPLA